MKMHILYFLSICLIVKCLSYTRYRMESENSPINFFQVSVSVSVGTCYVKVVDDGE